MVLLLAVGLGILGTAAETEALARSISSNDVARRSCYA